MLCSGKAMAPLIEKREVKRFFFEKKKKLNLSSCWHPDSSSTRIENDFFILVRVDFRTLFAYVELRATSFCIDKWLDRVVIRASLRGK